MKSLPYIHDSIIVTEGMCDHNGHMNVNHYYKLFDSTYTSFYINELGFDDDYIKSGFSTFTLEDSICLLYTSPSPRDATLSRMPSSA